MRNRSVVELMVLTFTFVVAAIILGTGFVVCVVEITDPEQDTTTIVQALLTLIAGILGALLGLLAGRASGGEDLHRRPRDLPPPGSPDG